MVGAAGFELATLCSQSRCATRLRYAPTANILTLKQAVLDAGKKKVAPEMHLSAFFCPTLPPRGFVALLGLGERGEEAEKKRQKAAKKQQVSDAECQLPRVMGMCISPGMASCLANSSLASELRCTSSGPSAKRKVRWCA